MSTLDLLSCRRHGPHWTAPLHQDCLLLYWGASTRVPCMFYRGHLGPAALCLLPRTQTSLHQLPGLQEDPSSIWISITGFYLYRGLNSALYPPQG